MIISSSKLSKSGYQYPSTQGERVKIEIELADHTIVSVLLAKDFKFGREFKKFDFVKMRSLYLPNNPKSHNLAIEQELALAKSLEKHFIELSPT